MTHPSEPAPADDPSAHATATPNTGGGPARRAPAKRGLFGLVKFLLLGFGISSPDERRENFRKWERYRRLREAERDHYGSGLDEAVRAEHARLEREAADRGRAGGAGGQTGDSSGRAGDVRGS